MRLLVVLGFSIILSSCCSSKRDCERYDFVSSVQFRGINANDLDTIWLSRYEPNKGFTTAIDSFEIINAVSGKDPELDLGVTLQLKYDLIFRLVSTGEVFRLNNFQTDQQICNWCFGVGNTYTRDLHSYGMNGQVIDENRLTIFR